MSIRFLKQYIFSLLLMDRFESLSVMAGPITIGRRQYSLRQGRCTSFCRHPFADWFLTHSLAENGLAVEKTVKVR